MALTIIRNFGRLKPEIRLGEAISNFEVDLTAQQMAAFRDYTHKSTTKPPTIDDVMRVTAEINRAASGRFSGKRCFGTRFTRILQAIQQFAGLGSVVLGGSQNLLACSVWSMLRMTLVSFVALSSFLDKISSILMMIGCSAPLHENMALLFPHSKNLWPYILEYCTIVVKLCHHLLAFTGKGLVQQLAMSVKDMELDLYQSELKKWSKLIDREASVLMCSTLLKQKSDLDTLTRLSKKTRHQERLQTYQRILDAFSKYDFQTTFNEIRKMGNTSLFLQMTEYISWKTRLGCRTLLCLGKLGSGKSVWMANVIDDLRLHEDSANYPIAYFFCRHDIAESLKAHTIVSSLTRQLLRPNSDFNGVEEIIAQEGPVLHFHGILKVLRKSLSTDFKAYVILDGLDDCHDVEKRKVVEQLRELQRIFPICVFMSSRQKADFAPNLDLELLGTYGTIMIPNNNPDIEAFIDEKLERCIESGKLAIGNPTIILEIQSALIQGSQGMFLWVALQIEALCTSRTDRAIRKALADLPKDLSEIFGRILKRSGEGGKDWQKKILEILIAACEPLTAEQLAEALSVVPGDTIWDPDQQLNDISAVLAFCGSLIYIDEEILTVRILHGSVKQFLLGEFSTSKVALFTEADARERMAAIIITYLNYNIFNTEVSTKVAPKINDAPARIVRTMQSSGTVGSIAVRLLRTQKQSTFDIGPTLQEVQRKERSREQFRFYSYARLHWLHYFHYVSNELPWAVVLLERLLERFQVVWNGQDEILAFISESINHNKVALMKTICTKPEIMRELPHLDGHMDSLRALVDLGLDGKSLAHAIENRHQELLQTLINLGLNVDTKTEGEDTLLFTALRYQNTEIAKMLIKRGANLSLDTSSHSTLHRAVRDGYNDGVALLIAEGVNLEATDSLGETPIFNAVRHGHLHIAGLLIDSGANLETKSYAGQTPLLYEVYMEHLNSIKLLIEGALI
ncbi:Ankyrin repeat and KH domain-containing protein mask [Cladobotryum mycophilum]|uniref:Ankyrin repeat and KH domain-containing protein mask n=1 Tax=Cladobotryum mycophilum TaxID=491253 RepID=A0ABR0SHJ3_9HYPO